MPKKNKTNLVNAPTVKTTVTTTKQFELQIDEEEFLQLVSQKYGVKIPAGFADSVDITHDDSNSVYFPINISWKTESTDQC